MPLRTCCAHSCHGAAAEHPRRGSAAATAAAISAAASAGAGAGAGAAAISAAAAAARTGTAISEKRAMVSGRTEKADDGSLLYICL